MELQKIEKVHDGKYLKNYELTYKNKQGKDKKYEIVSRREIRDKNDLGIASSGISIVATQGEKLLLLQEFRMGVNKKIYNLCAGMLEPNESPEECIRRELYEETGLTLDKIIKILPPSYAAVAFSDVMTSIAFVEASGYFSTDYTSANEEIRAEFYTRKQVARLLETEPFSSRAQMIAWWFVSGGLV